MKNVIGYFKGVCEYIRRHGLRITFPSIYLALLTFSLVISLFYRFTPFLYICPNLLGQELCAPLGVYIALFVSYPGYLFVAYAIPGSADWRWEFSSVVVILISALFYFIVGLAVDKFKKGNKNYKIKLTTICIFVFIFSLFLILIFANKA